MANVMQYFREVKQEALKVTWPSRKETVTTTIVVVIVIAIIASILLIADSIIASAIEFILGK